MCGSVKKSYGSGGVQDCVRMAKEQGRKKKTERGEVKIKADEVLMEKEEGAEKERMKGRKGGGNAEI